jgi:hypothetical protein
MFKKNILMLFLLQTTNLLHSGHEHHNHLLVFLNPYIHSLDGVNFMIDGVAIRNILGVMKEIMYIKNGITVDDKTTGAYVLGNERLSVQQLAELEKHHANDPRLAAVLKKAKHDFIESNKHFIKNIEPIKKLIISLMQEFCERRNKPNSIILDWAQAKSGTEPELFNRSIQNFTNFDLFLNDLILFLKDLVNSCPRAREQYREWYKQNRLLMEQ